jgi:hypothetical protein
MSKVLSIALACSFAALCAPVIAQAAKAKVIKTTADKCAIHPSDIRRQCAIELGGMCDPTTGTVTLDGPSGGSILGVQRFEECVSRKRGQTRR